MLRKPFRLVVHETYECDKSPKITFARNYSSFLKAEYIAKEIAEYIGNLYGTNYVEIIDRTSGEVVCEFEGKYNDRKEWLSTEIIDKIERIYEAE